MFVSLSDRFYTFDEIRCFSHSNPIILSCEQLCAWLFLAQAGCIAAFAAFKGMDGMRVAVGALLGVLLALKSEEFFQDHGITIFSSQRPLKAFKRLLDGRFGCFRGGSSWSTTAS